MSISLLERRHDQPANAAALRHAINDAQRDQLKLLERFGWTLKFVRRAHGEAPVAWVYDPDHQRLAAIGPDGRLDEAPGARVRH